MLGFLLQDEDLWIVAIVDIFKGPHLWLGPYCSYTCSYDSFVFIPRGKNNKMNFDSFNKIRRLEGNKEESCLEEL